MKDHQRITIIVEGLVQGVFYRDSTRRKASELDLVGTVRNLQDGSVEIVAEGPRDALEDLVHWARAGPSAAVVSGVKIIYRPPTGEFDDFQIRY
jgi:acylphosphatase